MDIAWYNLDAIVIFHKKLTYGTKNGIVKRDYKI